MNTLRLDLFDTAIKIFFRELFNLTGFGGIMEYYDNVNAGRI